MLKVIPLFGNFLTLSDVLANKPRNAKIVIVGAGMAGIAAAKELKQLGFSPIILEARDRIGNFKKSRLFLTFWRWENTNNYN